MFNKSIEKDCAYCVMGYLLKNETHVICKKYGMISKKINCSHFKYNPLKRTPKQKANLPDFSADDFSIK